MLQIRAAVAARGDADAHIVVELPAHESLRDLEQAADDDALEHDAVLEMRDAIKQHEEQMRDEVSALKKTVGGATASVPTLQSVG